MLIGGHYIFPNQNSTVQSNWLSPSPSGQNAFIWLRAADAPDWMLNCARKNKPLLGSPVLALRREQQGSLGKKKKKNQNWEAALVPASLVRKYQPPCLTCSILPFFRRPVGSLISALTYTEGHWYYGAWYFTFFISPDHLSRPRKW